MTHHVYHEGGFVTSENIVPGTYNRVPDQVVFGVCVNVGFVVPGVLLCGSSRSTPL